ncbi:hypothetical protein AB0F92_33100 [Kitasatospora aureofaciens]|uniref:hypothetical protein n=1 Tax=Kitasatospora aureofaciens TaxID=1894 RepID=UPI000B06B1F8
MNTLTVMSNSASVNAQVNGRAPLVRLYLVRGVLAAVWAVAFAHAHDTLGAAAITLLVAYPLLDAVSSAVDYLSVPDGPEQRVQAGLLVWKVRRGVAQLRV